MPWELTAFGETWNTEDLTVAEAENLEEEFDVSWLSLNPLLSIRHYRAVVATFLSRSMDPKVAAEKVRGMLIGELGPDNIRKVADNRPDLYEDGNPKVAATQPTDGSSSAPDGSGGPPT